MSPVRRFDLRIRYLTRVLDDKASIAEHIRMAASTLGGFQILLVEMVTIAGETDRARSLVDAMTIEMIKEKAVADLESSSESLYQKLQTRSKTEKED